MKFTADRSKSARPSFLRPKPETGWKNHIGDRLLCATASVCLRLVARIERVFKLPPEAVESALRRVSAPTAGKLHLQALNPASTRNGRGALKGRCAP